jgi:hypothetical protein
LVNFTAAGSRARNGLVGEGCAEERVIVQSLLPQVLAEISLALQQGGHALDGGSASQLPGSLVIHKEKRLVANDGTAHGPAKLIALQFLAGRRRLACCQGDVVREEIVGV